ncbi:hypothetical protein FPE01S_04_05100 [Flavihumibacter petaseus NBRC 106054]|uniref:Aldose 1-epimerase family protein n=1 Tax=Flavihumibacter petaseus NBRC 106054 TaxID=1220578 RepID=A0A0E9N6C0_9BACT|nr:hypothetical protein FPE01S_04_05100 [Flavihumibacter petaseus NBRC 106054]
MENEHLIVHLHPKGAELRQLKGKKTGINYLWSGDPAWWGKTSPVLFPIVGTLRDNSYTYQGKTYSLPRHGFARDKRFMVEQSSPLAANFLLQDDSETREVYPFSFQFHVFYALIEDRLSVRYTVVNTGPDTLWFSVGAHPAFAVPPTGVADAGDYEDHYLQFDRSDALVRYKLSDGLISDETETITLDNHVLRLNAGLFSEDAIVLKGLPDQHIRLLGWKHMNGIEFSWQDFPFFGIWAPAGAPFVCLEPWCGIADSVHHDKELTRKEGIRSLGPGDYFAREWSVRCF